jgi:hypothetical protein
VRRWSQPAPAKSLQALRSHLQKPLTEEEKIPISQEAFDELCACSPSELPRDALNVEQLSILFRVSTEQDAPQAHQLFSSAIRYAPPTEGTERVFHSTWDFNISRILQFILWNSRDIRNRSKNTRKNTKHPNYGLLIKNSCIFRGEERGSNSASDPERELVDKIGWTYSPLPYILGMLWILLRSERVLMYMRQDTMQ